MSKPNLQPLYDVLATIVHSDYPDPVSAVRYNIPNEIKDVLNLFDALPISSERKQRMLYGEMYYMETARTDIESFHKEGNYDDIELLVAIINRFKVDAERTRIFLELRERDWDAEINFAELDF